MKQMDQSARIAIVVYLSQDIYVGAGDKRDRTRTKDVLFEYLNVARKPWNWDFDRAFSLSLHSIGRILQVRLNTSSRRTHTETSHVCTHIHIRAFVGCVAVSSRLMARPFSLNYDESATHPCLIFLSLSPSLPDGGDSSRRRII